MTPSFPAVKAVTAAQLSMASHGVYSVTLDEAIEAMRLTASDMSVKYKETSLSVCDSVVVFVLLCHPLTASHRGSGPRGELLLWIYYLIGQGFTEPSLCTDDSEDTPDGTCLVSLIAFSQFPEAQTNSGVVQLNYYRLFSLSHYKQDSSRILWSFLCCTSYSRKAVVT